MLFCLVYLYGMIKYFRKQVYEIDIVAVYLQIEKEINEGKIQYSTEITGEAYLERLKTSIEVILEPDGVDVDQLLALKIPVVITPRFHVAQYQFWFAFQLMVINYRKIPFMLLYHFERWQNNVHFLNALEFDIIDIFERNNPKEKNQNADALFSWMYEARKQFGYSTKSKSDNNNQVIDIKYEEADGRPETVDITDTVVAEEAKVSRQTITVLIREEVIHQLTEIFRQFLFAQKDSEKLIKALKGNSLKKPIRLTCNISEFGYLISKLKAAPYSCILSRVDKLAAWGTLNFNFFSNRTGEYESASGSYLRAALVGSRPPGIKRRKELDKMLEGVPTFKIN